MVTIPTSECQNQRLAMSVWAAAPNGTGRIWAAVDLVGELKELTVRHSSCY